MKNTNQFIISTDTCADEMKSFYVENHIYYLPMRFICDNVEKEDDFNSEEKYKDFYERQNAGKQFSTSASNLEEFQAFFKNILEKEKKDIVHFCLSSGLSGTCQNAKMVAEEINQTSKNKVFVIDSLTATSAISILLRCAMEYRDKGMSAKEAYEQSLNNLKHTSASFFLTDLDTLRKGGRISGASAVIGKLANIRPCLIINAEGKLEVVAKVIGTKKAVQFLEDRLKLYDGVSPIFIVYAENEALANEMMERLKIQYPKANIQKKLLGPVICSHTGPSLIGLGFQTKMPIK